MNITAKSITLKIRKRMPVAVRKLARLFYHSINSASYSALMPPDLLIDCRFCASRYDLIGHLPKHGRVAELGTLRGDFAAYILTTSIPSEMHVIDLDLRELRQDVRSNKNVTTHQGTTTDILSKFPDLYFDWIYVDADHSYEGVSRDARIASQKVRPGGYLVFNDFAHMDPALGAYGVHRAVMDFAVEHRWPFSWFGYEPSALYDVALRRPETV